MMKIRKVVIPAAGFGTRFLPMTKATPKEMLPVVDKPVIQYVVEEALSAGIEDVIIVTSSMKRPIEDHFDIPGQDLIKNLTDGGKLHMLDDLNRISDMANFIYVRQKGMYGNGTPVKCARPVVGNEPFLVLWGDEFFVTPNKTHAQQVVEAFDKYQATILCGIITDNPEHTKRYGYVQGEEIAPGVWRVDRLIEKPGPGNAPSNLAILSGYALTPDIFPILESQGAGTGGECYLADAIDKLAQQKPVYAIVLEYDKYMDSGTKMAYMQTVVEMGMRHPEIGPQFKEFLKGLKID